MLIDVACHMHVPLGAHPSRGSPPACLQTAVPSVALCSARMWQIEEERLLQVLPALARGALQRAYALGLSGAFDARNMFTYRTRASTASTVITRRSGDVLVRVG